MRKQRSQEQEVLGKWRIRRGDEVVVISGRNKGARGRIARVVREDRSVVVEGVNLLKKAVKSSPEHPEGGYIQIAAPIHSSNVMVVDPKTQKPSRVGFKILEDGKKVRIAVRSGEILP